MPARHPQTPTVAWLLSGALIAAAVVLSVVAPVTGEAASEPVIDTGAPVSPGQCVACHDALGRVDVPGLIFSHGNHLLVSCDGCHARMPHLRDATERVPMEVCFACHGVSHGEQGELATRACRACHTPSFELRPQSHSATWAKEPHAKVARERGVNACMMCHEAAKDCDRCHAQEAPGIGPMPRGYHPVLEERPRPPSVKVFPKGRVSMSQCVFCHVDVDDVTPGRLIFAHAAHIQRDYRCEACHARFPHRASGIERPDMQSCYRCHGLSHNARGQVAPEECALCHPKAFDLTPANHTRAFVRRGHGARANKDAAYCAMCHKTAFCVGCHRGKKVSPNAPGRPVIPADHRKAAWRGQHGALYLDGRGLCGSCHDDPSCKRCHKTVMPHPTDWVEDHAPDPAVGREDCAVCHRDRERCQACHHAKVWQARLTRKNCTPCHPEMRKRPATDIKHKAFAEHAVHFEVEKKKGKPYGCYECHVDFGVSAAAERAEQQQAHDLRLCYGCHGALDPFDRLIADYKGAALCVRCHDDIGL